MTITWEFLLEHLNNLKYARHPSMIEKYNIFYKKIINKYYSLNNYILIKYFKYSSKIEDNKIKSLHNKKNKTFILTKNKFPYNFEKNLDHYILWSNIKISHKTIDYILNTKLKNKVFFWFENKIENKSIPDLYHVHVIINNSLKKPKI